jgi:hypothetical protein
VNRYRLVTYCMRGSNARAQGRLSVEMNRLDDLRRFNRILGVLEEGLGGARILSECNGRLSWPQRGVYFFMEQGEERSDTGTGRRIVRVGTHALTQGSRTKLWNRLSQHRGQIGGGNHRGSIFRLIIGTALMADDGDLFSTWGKGSTATVAIRSGETRLECEVSKVVGAMPILWLAVDDDPGKASLRGYIERNSIALLSNYRKPRLDPASQTWLGHYCNRERVRESCLWNSNHVDEQYDPARSSIVLSVSFPGAEAAHDRCHAVRIAQAAGRRVHAHAEWQAGVFCRRCRAGA